MSTEESLPPSEFQQKLWPPELLYWRRMGSRELSDHVEATPPENRLVLVTWGVLEAHGPYLALGLDAMMAQVATDRVAFDLHKKHGIRPIIFNSFADIGTYSVTKDIPGSVAIEDWEQFNASQTSPMLEIWHAVIGRLKREGFERFFLINGDGGNWMNYMARPNTPDFISLKQVLEQAHGVHFAGSNWDQEGGVAWKHGESHSHAFVKWVCDFAPDFERFASLRHGIRPAPEEELHALDGTNFVDTVDGRRISNWPKILAHPELRGVAEFSLEKYRELLYEADGKTPRASGGIQEDYEAKIQHLTANVLKFVHETGTE
ncbi:MAG: hypothetical protein A3F04_01260 [Candidatus Chisholmbacteria bacterium RIFCSPHIGHO2_12_FULL_49_9]|uniref:Creatininase n=1 Tax=Candidatus Chisholmbacteria bacterium RIFCSPHIGHO2_01_FULL_52_32 TaxID=1797591 RepID=A0A1G1VTH2_9BACT|nr:MAG: hypothetical protein A2786_03950 [Candidatus Chisholmbacteria bacterium RIFCSPHIGHO2_01_FULL_52_32]OGY20005.1 MAG: hypothetical protein A2900_02795 [Candidatus Chisholmbacteria bacterium RIFCSPLOWO2_01_FULL_50_28]OGY21211.1 MAG: hypothetical protein A3F04_01260 [Candidatus Chisholmbacteria bacterium RIFCSPHIGHO2_12_FULL_49_9]